jgi:hypothetical protein
MAEVSDGGHGVSVQLPPFRAVDGTAGVYPGGASFGRASEAAGDKPVSVPERMADLQSVVRGSRSSYRAGGIYREWARLIGESQEVQFDTNTVPHLPGGPPGSGPGSGWPFTGTGDERGGLHIVTGSPRGSAGSFLEEGAGADGQPCGLGSHWTTHLPCIRWNVWFQ